MRRTFNIIVDSLERTFHFDAQYFIKGSFWLTLGQGVSALSALILSVVFANLLAPESYGIYKYILSLVSLVAIFSLTGIGTAVTRAIAKDNDAALKIGFYQSLRWSTGFVAILTSIGAYYLIQNNFILGVSFFIAAILNPLISATSLYTCFLSGKKHFKQVTLYQIASGIFTTTSLISCLYLTDNLLVIIFTYFLTSAIGPITAYIHVQKLVKPTTQSTENVVTFAKNLSIVNVITGFAFQIDKIIVFQFLGPAQLAVYAFAIALPEQIWGLIKGWGQLMIPKFATYSDIEIIKKSLPRKIILMGLTVSVIAITYIIAAPYIFSLLFPNYLEAISYSQIFTLSLIALVSVIPLSLLTARKNEKELYFVNISTSLVQIILLIPAVLHYGLWGVIISRIITRYVQLFIALGSVYYKK